MREAARRTVLQLIAAVPPLERPVRRLALMTAQVPVVKRYGPARRPITAVRHVLTNRELGNFTYEIGNVGELTQLLAAALDEPEESVARLIRELQDDTELESALRGGLAERPDRNDSAPYGRRLGWYVITRVAKPRLVVETGTHDGLGSSVILRALARNALEGRPGRLLTVDIDPGAGWLIPTWLRGNLEQRFEDSLQALSSSETIDFAVVDSDHSYEHECEELEIIARRAEAGTVIVSDNPGSRAFADFCKSRGLRNLEFRERPLRHIHPGAGLALTRFVQSTLAEVPPPSSELRSCTG
jgi:predicted O-methyltransferase YrrM